MIMNEATNHLGNPGGRIVTKFQGYRCQQCGKMYSKQCGLILGYKLSSKPF